MFLVAEMAKAKLTVSHAEGRRLISLRSVQLNGVLVEDVSQQCEEGDIITIGQLGHPKKTYQIPIVTVPTPKPLENDWTEMDWTKV